MTHAHGTEPAAHATAAGRLFAGPGEMRALCRALDWASSPLGDVAGWPAALCAAVRLTMDSGFPICLYAGPDLVVIYNDAYIPALDARHPGALGRPVREVWSEIRDEIGPDLAGVVATGSALAQRDRRFLIERHGRLEETFWTYAFSPIRDEDGRVLGVHHLATETTGRVSAESAMRASEARYRALATASADVIYRMSPDWREMKRLEGRGLLEDTLESSGAWLERYILPEDRTRVTAEIDAAVQGKRVFELEHRVRRADGATAWTFSRAVPMLDDAGEIVEWIGTASDVTARREGEAALRAREAGMRLAMEATAMVAWEWDPLADRITTSAGFTEVYGLPALAGVAEGFALVHPQDRPAHAANVARVAERGGQYRSEFRITRPSDGRTVWLEERASAITDASGRVIRVVGVVGDVTDRKRAEAALLESEERYRTLFESMGQGYCDLELVRDADGQVVDLHYLKFNPAFERIFGIPVEQAEGRYASEIFPGLERWWFDSYDRVVQAGTPDRIQHEVVSLGRWYEARAYPRGGNRLTVLFDDITERTHAETALRESEAQRELALEATQLGTFIWDVQEDRTDADARMLALLDLQPGGLSVRDALATMIHPDDVERYADAVAAALRPEGSGRMREDVRMRRADGGWRWLSIAGKTGFDDAGRPVRMVGAALDITERKLAEAVLAEEQNRQAFLLRLSDTLRPLKDPVAIQEAAMKVLAEEFGVMRASYHEILPDGDTFRLTAGYEAGAPPIPDQMRISDFSAVQAADYRRGRTLVLRDSETEAQPEAYRAIGVRAGAAVPLVKGGQLVALVAMSSGVPRDWTKMEVRMLEELAERTWAAVERARAEQALQQSEEKYRTLFERMDEGFALCELVRDADGHVVDYRYVDLNPALARHGGIEPAALRDRRANEVFPSLDPWLLDTYVRVVETGESVMDEHYFPHVERWLRINAFPRGGDRFAVLFGDVTERRRTEEALRASEARFRTVADVVPDLLWESEPDGSTPWYNERWYEYTGQAPERARGWGWMDTIHPDDRERSAANYARAAECGETLVQEHRIRRHDGAYRWFLVRAEPLRDESGRVTRWFGAATDVHAHRMAIEEAERLAARRTAERDTLRRELAVAEEAERRRLARELHDEVGQQLTALGLGLQALSNVTPPGSEVDRRAAELRALVSTMGQELHAVAVRLRPRALDDFGLEAALTTYVEEWARQSGIAAGVHAPVESERLPAAVESAVYRIVQEALTNVARHSGATRASVVVERRDGHVFAIVEDDGRGFDTDAPGAARDGAPGLGLLGIRERTTLLGGTMDIESVPGAGTTLFVRLPIQIPSGRDHTDDASNDTGRSHG